MIMSKGREAFTGDVNEAIPYFERIGFPCPRETNPAEFFLDLCNADFSDDTAVDRLLDTWEECKPGAHNSSHHGQGYLEDDDDNGQKGVVAGVSTSFSSELIIMMRRHATLIVRDPILYLGRCGAGLLVNMFFAFVYWNARVFEQDQLLNKLWINVWFCSVITNMGVVAVYALNDEYKSITREAKNGMTSGLSYVMAKNILTIPFILLLSVCCLGIPAFVIMDIPGEAAKMYFILFAALMFVFESVAELFSILFDDPIVGMLSFMNYWFASFLFGGFVIPLDDLYYPWTAIYYVMPFSYFVRSAIYEAFAHATFETCPEGTFTAICLQEERPNAGVPGVDVVAAFERVMPLADPEDNTTRDILMLLFIGLFYKLLYTVGVVLKTRRVAMIHETMTSSSSKRSNSAKTASSSQSRDTKAFVGELVSKPVPVAPADNVYDNEIEV